MRVFINFSSIFLENAKFVRNYHSSWYKFAISRNRFLKVSETHFEVPEMTMVANPIQILEEAQKQFQEGDKLNVQLLDEVGFYKFP